MARVNLIQLRRGTALAWTTADPVLASGEGGFETDTGKIKYGDGTTAWTSLPYINGGGDAATLSGASLSTDGTFAANSDTLIPSQKAVKTYVDNIVTGLWDDRGNYDASVNTFPATGGSGNAGAILKGDIWTISVAGLLGGVQVDPGDTVRALTNTPGQTASNWALGEVNLGYTPENSANKDQASGYAGLTAASLLKTAQFPAFTGDVTTTAGGVATVIGAGKVTNAMLAGSIAASKLVGTDIATVGTITSGVWNATTIAIANGGTGATTAIGAHDALQTQSSAIASAATTDLSTATGEYASITGTTTITAFGTVPAGAVRVLNFAGVLTLTHNATSLILPGNANIITAAGDIAVMRSLGSGNWVCQSYVPRALVPGNAFKLQTARTINGSSFDGSANILVDVDGGAP